MEANRPFRLREALVSRAALSAANFFTTLRRKNRRPLESRSAARSPSFSSWMTREALRFRSRPTSRGDIRTVPSVPANSDTPVMRCGPQIGADTSAIVPSPHSRKRAANQTSRRFAVSVFMYLLRQHATAMRSVVIRTRRRTALRSDCQEFDERRRRTVVGRVACRRPRRAGRSFQSTRAQKRTTDIRMTSTVIPGSVSCSARAMSAYSRPCS